MNKKGFTLIELLAVIVILAIIALITAPIILGVIENARKDSAKDKAWGTINAVELAYTQDQVKDSSYILGTPVTFNNKKASVGSVQVKASGELPESGTVTIREDGSIIANNLKFDSYTCSTIKSETNKEPDPNNMVCVKGDGSLTPTTKTVYRYTKDQLKIGDSIEGIEVTIDPTTLGHNHYLKHELSADNKITASYTCFVTDKEYCMQGGQPSAYETNLAILKSQEQWFINHGGSCSTAGDNYNCMNATAGNLAMVNTGPNGTAGARDNNNHFCYFSSSVINGPMDTCQCSY